MNALFLAASGATSQLAGLEQEKVQRGVERLVLQQTVAKLEQTLPLVARRASHAPS